jgi:spore maturation protein CgeB
VKILLAGAYRYFWYEEVCAQALEKLGHHVLRYRWDRFFKGKLGTLQEKWLLGPSIVWLNRDFVACARSCQADVIFLWRATPIWPATLQALRSKTSALLVAYNNDDPFGPTHQWALWRYFIQGIPDYDVHFVYRRVNVLEYLSAGARHVEVLMPYYIPELHQPRVLEPADQERYGCDLVFVGHYENDGRVNYLRALVKSGLKVRLFGGKYWRPKVLGDLAHHFEPVFPAFGEEYVKALIGARICLAFLSRLNRDSYSRRSFEIPACGCLMLSERTSDLTKLYKEDEEAVFFSSQGELVEKAHALLTDNERRKQIGQAGRERCMTDGHDVVNRMRQFSRAIA